MTICLSQSRHPYRGIQPKYTFIESSQHASTSVADEIDVSVVLRY